MNNNILRLHLKKEPSLEELCTRRQIVESEVSVEWKNSAGSPDKRARNHRNDSIYNVEIGHNLDLSGYSLEEIPEKIVQWHGVKNLYLSNNKLKSIPESLFTLMPSLQWLDLRYNFLSDLPESVGEHKSLQVLLLQENQFRHLPPHIALIPSLRAIQWHGNPLESPPEEVLAGGITTIMKYLMCLLNNGGNNCDKNLELSEGENSQNAENVACTVIFPEQKLIPSTEEFISFTDNAQEYEVFPVTSEPCISETFAYVKEKLTSQSQPHCLTPDYKQTSDRRQCTSEIHAQIPPRILIKYHQEELKERKKTQNMKIDSEMQKTRDRDTLRKWRTASVRKNVATESVNQMSSVVAPFGTYQDNPPSEKQPTMSKEEFMQHLFHQEKELHHRLMEVLKITLDHPADSQLDSNCAKEAAQEHLRQIENLKQELQGLRRQFENLTV